MLTTYDSSEPGGTPRPDVAGVSPRRGPKGLWGALATASAPAVGARALPLADTSSWGGGVSMFAYDAEQAIDLGFDLERLLEGSDLPD